MSSPHQDVIAVLLTTAIFQASIFPAEILDKKW
jgi:hypothetical protein